MNFDTFDNDVEDTSDKDYFAFVEWLSEQTGSELRHAKGNPAEERQVLYRYYKRGYRANLTHPELIDFLAISSPSILDRAGYDDSEGDALMPVSASLTEANINEATLPDLGKVPVVLPAH